MQFHFSAHGLSFRPNVPLPALEVSAPPRGPVVEVFLGERPPWRQEAAAEPRQVHLTSGPAEAGGVPDFEIRKFRRGGTEWFELAYSDGTEFTLDAAGTQVWGVGPETVPLEDLALCLMGPVLGFVLRLHGVVSLHASALAVGGRALVLAGPAGVGKSTTAAALVRLGHGVLCDDLLALRESGGEFFGHPGCPRLRLWPETAQAVCETWRDLPKIAPNWDKRYVDLAGGEARFEREPLPLGAIYVLSERTVDDVAPSVEDLDGPEGFMALVANSYVNRFLDKQMRAREFEVLGRVVAQVPLRRVRLHGGLGRLGEARDLILEDFGRLARPPASASG